MANKLNKTPFYLAKSDGTSLFDHSCAVCDTAIDILDDAGVIDDTLRRAVEIAALSHDIGKTMQGYQDYITDPNSENGEIYTEKYPRHNEVSAALFHSMINVFGPNIMSVIESAIRYHHTNKKIEIPLSDLYTKEQLVNVRECYEQLFNRYGITDVKFEDLDAALDSFVEPLPQFDFISGTANDLVDDQKKLTNYEIIFNTVRYSDIIVSSDNNYNIKRPNSNITNSDLSLPESYDKERWEQQILISEKLKSLNYAILKATMGYGKTICGLRYLLSFDRLGFWVCPDNSVAETTYDNILRTLNECNLLGINIALLLGGKWIHGGEDSDIIVTNIDTYENGVFRNSRKAISFKSLFANAIFDEYHEYLLDNNPLSSMFVSIIEARKKMERVKTLLMSGTLANGPKFLNLNEENIVYPDGCGIEKKKKIRFHYINPNEIQKIAEKSDNYFVIHSTIKDCQNNFSKNDIGQICLHSRFDENDLETKNLILFESNGKKATKDSITVASTSTISRAYDLSFKRAFLINPNPFQILQATGRINRWDYDKEVGDLYISIDKKSLGIYIDLKTRKYSKLWTDIYEPYIAELKTRFPEDSETTIFELDDFMLEYFKSKDTIRRIASITIRSGFEKLKNVEFRRGTAIEEGKSNVHHSSDKMDVRGECMTRFVKVQIEGEKLGLMSDVMALPFYAFDSENGFEVLNNETNLTDVIRYFSNNLDVAAKYFIGCNVESKLKTYKKSPQNIHKLHKKLMELSTSDETPYPILVGYSYNHEIGFFKKI